jgi:hypothetical protein
LQRGYACFLPWHVFAWLRGRLGEERSNVDSAAEQATMWRLTLVGVPQSLRAFALHEMRVLFNLFVVASDDDRTCR